MKTSYEPSRSSAYSEDLRWKVIWQREGLGYTYGEISVTLGVDASTVQRTGILFKNTESVHKCPYPRIKQPESLHLLLSCLCYILKPGIYLHIIQKEVQVSLLLEVSLSTLCKFLLMYSQKTLYSCLTAR